MHVEIKGNRYFTAEMLRERMFLQPAGFLYLRRGRYSQGFAKRDEDSVTALYKSNGFRDVQVTTRTIENYQGKNAAVAAEVTVTEGPQYFVEGFKVTGMQQVEGPEITSQLASVGPAF